MNTLKNNALCHLLQLKFASQEQLQNVSGQSVQIILATEYKTQHIHGVDRKCNEMTPCLQEKSEN